MAQISGRTPQKRGATRTNTRAARSRSSTPKTSRVAKGRIDLNDIRIELIRVKEIELTVSEQRKRLVRQLDLTAPGKSVLTEQRRWNATTPPLRAQPPRPMP